MKTYTSLTAIPSEIADRLAILAPCIAFSVSREIDPHYRWDGDGEDPCDAGFDAYDVTVTATAILDGRIAEGDNRLGGSYFLPDEPTGDIHGYLLQMLQEATQDLCDTLARRGGYHGERLTQLAHVRGYLREAMRAAYEAQRAGKN